MSFFKNLFSKKQILNQNDILSEFINILKLYFNNTVLEYVQPRFVQEGTLVVSCTHNYMLEELDKRKDFFMNQLNNRFEKAIIEDLAFIKQEDL